MRRPALYPYWFLADKATEDELLYYAVHSQCSKLKALSTRVANGASTRNIIKRLERRYRTMLEKLKP